MVKHFQMLENGDSEIKLKTVVPYEDARRFVENLNRTFILQGITCPMLEGDALEVELTFVPGNGLIVVDN